MHKGSLDAVRGTGGPTEAAPEAGEEWAQHRILAVAWAGRRQGPCWGRRYVEPVGSLSVIPTNTAGVHV